MLVNKVEIYPKIETGKIGEVAFFNISIFPMEANNKEITIESSNPEIIEVFHNSFRFKKRGVARITVSSKDGNYKNNFVLTCEQEIGYLETALKLEERLLMYSHLLSKDLSKDKEGILFEINNTKLQIIKSLENELISTIDKIGKFGTDKINDFYKLYTDKITIINNETLKQVEKIKSNGNDKLEEINIKLKEIKNLTNVFYLKINELTDNKINEATLTITSIINDSKITVENIITTNINNLKKEIEIFLTNIDKREDIAIQLITKRTNEGITFIEGSEKTAIENIRLETEEMKKILRLELENLDITINGQLNKVVQEIERLKNETLIEISKLEISITNKVDFELKKVKEILLDDYQNIQNSMNEYNIILKNELIEKKNSLMSEIVIDKDGMLMELEREKNRLINIIREEEFKLFQGLNETQQAIISRIQLVVQGYDTVMEEMKNLKIQELNVIISQYDVMITEAINKGKEQITNFSTSYLNDLLNKKIEYENVLNTLKTNLSNSLSSEKNTHSTNLTSEYNTHRTNLNDQVNNAETGLRKILRTDYETFNTNLTTTKDQYLQALLESKNSGINEIDTVKNRVLETIGQNENAGLWKTVKDGIISTGNAQKTILTAEGERIQALFSEIESSFIQTSNNALNAIGIDNNSGKRGEAITAIVTEKNNTVNRIGTSDSAMNGNDPSLRKEIVDRLNTLSVSLIEGLNLEATKLTEISRTQILDIKDLSLSEIETAKFLAKSILKTALETLLLEKDVTINALLNTKEQIFTDSENKKIEVKNELEKVKNEHINTIATITSLSPTEVEAIWTQLK